MKSRSKPRLLATKKPEVAVSPEVTSKLLPQDDNPPRLFILPKAIAPEATIVALANPRTLQPTRYYFCPRSGFYEIRTTQPDRGSYRSWLLEPRSYDAKSSEPAEETIPEVEDDGSEEKQGSSLDRGYALKTPEVFTVTSMDPMFLLLPALSPMPSTSKAEELKALFLSTDDSLESIFEQSKHFREVVANSSIRNLLETRMAAVCDTVDAGDEKMYRLSNTKLLSELIHKARKMVAGGIPQSMERKFVAKPLERPMLAVKRVESSVSEVVVEKDAEETFEPPATDAPPIDSIESQSSNATLALFESQVSTATSITVPEEPVGDSIPTELVQLQRLRVALDFMISAYVPVHLAKTLNELLNTAASPLDFTTLDQHVAEIAKLKAEAAAQRAIGDFTRKRGFEEDEAAIERLEKKRKMEEDEKRKKANESRGVKDLKKADISGMKKMSDFFRKAPAKAK